MRVHVVDSHTGGEPTRLVLEGGPDLGSGSVPEQMEQFRLRHDSFRAGVAAEPRGNDAIVGALLCKPADPSCQFGVIFFNNVGYLGMCGHGTIGLVATLAHLGRIPASGEVRIETPVGVVTAISHGAGFVSVRNVPSYRHARNVTVEVPGHGAFSGDVAWGGNWFYLTKGDSPIEISVSKIDELSALSWRIRRALEKAGVTGKNGGLIDHIELFSPPRDKSAHSRNFVLCPGGAYDRSPCGTGTSAKMACLFADSILQPGVPYRQESVTGSIFEGWVEAAGEQVIPTIKGSAFVTAESDLIFNEQDPFCWGIPT